MSIYDFESTDGIRTNISKFINDTKTHPIVKYKAFIGLFILSISGICFLFLFNSDRFFNHAYWRYMFKIPTIFDKYAGEDGDEGDDVFQYKYSKINMSSASVFRKAIEGFDINNLPTVEDGKNKKANGSFASADVKGAEKNVASKKNTPCPTDCGQYIELQGKINTLAKMVDEVKDQNDGIKQVSDGLQAVGNQIKDLSKSLSPGGQVKIKL
jgi:hypothetical protein